MRKLLRSFIIIMQAAHMMKTRSVFSFTPHS